MDLSEKGRQKREQRRECIRAWVTEKKAEGINCRAYYNGHHGVLENYALCGDIVQLPYFIHEIADRCFENSGLENLYFDTNNCYSVGERAFAGSSIREFSVYSDMGMLYKETFKGCRKLRSIDLHETKVDYIGVSCFEGCESLEDVVFSYVLQRLGDYCFKGCTALKRLVLRGSHLGAIGTGAFQDCTNLEELVLPFEMLELYGEIFRNTPKLKRLELPYGFLRIHDTVFDGSSIEEVTCYRDTYEQWKGIFDRNPAIKVNIKEEPEMSEADKALQSSFLNRSSYVI